MLPRAQNAQERVRQLEFYKQLIKDAFRIIDMENKGHVDKKEVVYIMRYLLQFPSDAQIRDHILDFISQGNDPDDNYVSYKQFEPFMLNVLLNNEYEPTERDQLLQAFRVLDPEGKGYVKKDVMEYLFECLKLKRIHISERVRENFMAFAVDRSGEFIYYEDYVAKLLDANETHR